jgi:hypothetical protein
MSSDEVTKDWPASRRTLYRWRVMAVTSVLFTQDVIWPVAALFEADGMSRWRARWQVTRFLFGEPGIFRKLGPCAIAPGIARGFILGSRQWRETRAQNDRQQFA